MDNENERLASPPLSPMHSVDGQSSRVSINSKAGKAIYTKPSSTTSMETHWEEMIQQPEKTREKSLTKSAELHGENDDSESELLAIPETDIDFSDSTLHDSAQVDANLFNTTP